MGFLWSFKLLITFCTVCYKLSRVYGSLCFELLPQQMSQSKKKFKDVCEHANKYKHVMLETLS